MPVIKLLPQIVDLELYAGDGVTLAVIATDMATNQPIDVSRGTLLAQIRRREWTPDPPAAVFTIDKQNATEGQLFLSLTSDQTANLVTQLGGYGGVWDMQWNPSAIAQPTTLIKGKVSVDSNVSR